MNSVSGSQAFLNWLDGWYVGLGEIPLDQVVKQCGGPEKVAVLVVDLLVGFCTEGALASPRVAALGPKAAEFLTAVRERGVRNVLVAADSHPENSPEFAAFPPHCIRGTREAEAIPELQSLPFWAETPTIEKGSLNFGHEAAFQEWQRAHPEVTGWILVGDCTDLCIYSAAMHLRLQANSQGLERHIWVPADLVDTYDLPVETAQQVGAMPHDGDLMHRVFLYHLALNGVNVVRRVVP